MLISRPKVPPATAKPTKPRQTSTFAPTTAGTRPRPQTQTSTGDSGLAEILLPVSAASRQESWEDSELFKPEPSSDLDALGKKRYVGRWRLHPTAPNRFRDSD